MKVNLNSDNVLVLNAMWQRIGTKNAKEAITDLTGINEPAKAMDISYPLDANGQPDFSQEPEYFNPVDWETWITLPIRPWDSVIHSARFSIRVPTVILNRFSKVPMKHPKPTAAAIRERDKGRCQYTGELLTKGEGNIDHVIPRAKGGKDNWENLVYCSKKINSMKGDRLNEEVGISLLRKPTAPKPIPISSLITIARHRDWQIFMKD